MREAGFDKGRVEIDKPDGTVIRVVAGEPTEAAEADDLDAMIAKVPDAMP